MVGEALFTHVAEGFTEDDYEPVEVWPENVPAWDIFSRLLGQWRTAGVNGVRTALDYTSLYPLLDRVAPNSEDWLQLLDDIRVIEAAALRTMHAS